MEAIKFVLSISFRIFFNLVAFTGALILVYSMTSLFYPDAVWLWFEERTPLLASSLTITGTLLAAISIYLYPEISSPLEKVSIYVTAPIVIMLCFAGVFVLIKFGTLPNTMLNGFALLAIAGALLRLQPNPYNDERIYHKRG